MKITNAKPFFPQDDIPLILDEIKKSLEAGILTFGPNVSRLEKEFAEYAGVKNAIAVNSGTSALEIALRYYDLKGGEVIVPTNSFVASANAVILAGGKPVFVDIKQETLCLDPDDVKKKITSKTKGIMVVHLAGLIPPEINEIKEICEEKNLFLIEDAAHAHGSSLNDKHAGSFGDVGCFSFFPTKPMTTGEGGIITTNNEEIAEFAKIVRHHGKEGNEHTKIGYNWRMSEINAILGVYQLNRLDEFVRARNRIASRYVEELDSMKELSLIPVPENAIHSFWKYPVLLNSIKAPELEVRFREKYEIALGTIYYPPIHLQPYYIQEFGNKPGMLPVSEDVLLRETCLPIFVDMTDEMVDSVIMAIKKELK
jgi:dTDP-4-amino-4,6-dideoxygalactose transaminase